MVAIARSLSGVGATSSRGSSGARTWGRGACVRVSARRFVTLSGEEPASSLVDVRVDVGPVVEQTNEEIKMGVKPGGQRKPRRFKMPRTMKDSSMGVVTLARPMGVVFVPDTNGRIRVAEIIENSEADRLTKREMLTGGLYSADRETDEIRGICVGDVLRGLTTQRVEIPTAAALTGDLSGAQRQVILMDVTGVGWKVVSRALRQWSLDCGDMSLVIERPPLESAAAVWKELEPPKPEQRPLQREEKGMGVVKEADGKGEQREVNVLEGEKKTPLAANIVFAGVVFTIIGLFVVGFR